MGKERTKGGEASAGGMLVPVECVTRSILLVRGQKVLLDRDLAELNGVSVRQLNQALKRNAGRFPGDFAFRMTLQGFDNLRSQVVISRSWGGRRYAPYAFTEHGAVMLASVLRSEIAVAVSVQVVRAFVRLRQMIMVNEKLRRKLAQIERKVGDHDRALASAFRTINQLIERAAVVESPKSRIGYETESKRHG